MLARSLCASGRAHLNNKETAAALADYGRARDIMLVLVRQNPSAVDFQNDLANCWFDLGTTHFRDKQQAEAVNSFQEAVNIRRKLVAAAPDRLDFRHDLAGALDRLAIMLASSGRRDEAVVNAREAVQQQALVFKQSPQSLQRRDLGRMYTHVIDLERNTDHCAASVAAIQERLKLWPNNPAETYVAARDLARAAGSIGKGVTVVAAEAEADAPALCRPCH